ncbi:polyribonucleotide nucleotidyltransferase [Prevotella melaninogenica]|jgi:polyribonucleotide nucleotidyltransferase|uniref:Polyribonucleotide nucleotidyltransferase n=1 Tax=Prevotella melaninogenica TaxID=28132 RepID=A0ABS6Y304_9BACT|nr:polyribonucleotide nucleotidyltransferase [Prevotella melaninogenica]MBF1636616.1 polyribonucleotide nucleotidyltransferase [Prevotella sp.]MBW4740937.1 polyribonucleotide nucleotidyltransferase [Prevotella melaninogenica]MBW4753869.1 polyribonucleotide nucleotidyltransferase [Prevotella melaninogenica]MBW4761063.1 polyribonucleotide nucleotidyltransferase [Prevotella melaninogenica]MBW4911710.1 polyribonucleotide nucleotidyltransferase [Prevotella melaninogenica]
MNVITKTVQLPDGRTISIETGKVAKQADGAAVLRMGNTVLLATVCAAKEAVPGTDFMPLQVDYREQYAAAGRYPGGFTKREGKANDDEILTSRLVDRVLRPLFPSDYHCEVYVQVMLLSADGVDQPDALAGLAASAALAASDIPIEHTTSEVRVARVNGEYVINPTFEQMKEADMDLMVGATKDNIMMVEGEMDEVSEQDLIGALKAAHEAIKPMCEMQEELSKACGTDVKRAYEDEVNDEELREELRKATYDACYAQAQSGDDDKKHREETYDKIKSDFTEAYDAAHTDLSEDDLEEKHTLIDRYFADVQRDSMRRSVLDTGKRMDGRATDEIRPIWCEIDTLPMPHGSSLFQRGETMSLSTCTLGTKMDEKMVDNVLEKSYQRFLLHYNFPPFCTGEAKAQRGVGRREIGHGHLAWRGLKGQIPADFPYTVRLVSQILESNGSSSMATVCAGTLALMDAGVPMKKPVSGIAMGLIKNPGEDKYAVLSDILGDEDHLGDMDFKTTGTKDGLTATQMDIKCDGLSFEILEKALMQAKAAREHILNIMTETIAEPRAEMKPQVPRIVQLEIPKEFIGAVIGPGGKIIQQMQEETGATITIEETDGVGKVQVSAPNKDSIDAALGKIKAIVAVPEIGEVYEGTVRSIMPYGCFVEILPGKDGLLHISEIDWKRLETVEEAGIKEGDKIKVKLLEIDPKTGKYKLSRRVLLEKPEGYVEPQRRPRGDRRPRRDGERRFDERRPRRENNESENND